MKTATNLIMVFIALQLFAQHKTTYTYSIKGADTLKLDIYTPDNLKRKDRLPVLLWMHGGSFSGGNRDSKDETNLMKYVAGQQNYIGIAISYRLLRKGKETGFGCNCPKDEKLETFKQAVIDYMDAAKFIDENAKRLKIDTSKIIAGGSSAGAEVILNTVFMRDYFLNNPKDYENVQFAGAFSLAGAMLDRRYLTKNNAVPSVFYHGTEDKAVPFGTAAHHYCKPTDPGYLILDGSDRIVERFDDLEASYYFNGVNGGQHEISGIPFQDLDKIFDFFEHTVHNGEIIQTKLLKTKK